MFCVEGLEGSRAQKMTWTLLCSSGYTGGNGMESNMNRIGS